MSMANASRSSTALRALRVLEVVSRSASPVTVAAVANGIGVDRVTAYRMLMTLVGAGYVLRDESGRYYRLSHKIISLGRNLLLENARTELVHSCLRELSATTQETVHFSILDGSETVVVQGVKGTQLVAVHFEVGDRARLHCTSIGKAVLAYQDSGFVEHIIRSGLPRLARNTITQPEALRTELARVRAQGFAIDDFEFADDMRCIAVPVFESGAQVTSGISFSGPSSRFGFEKLDELRILTVTAARDLSEKLGGTPWTAGPGAPDPAHGAVADASQSSG